ncbi:MAG: hypothetical protein QM831_28765 [Kofleriaceae bacterium]
MRWLLVMLLFGCHHDKSPADDPEIQIAKRDWKAESDMLAAGERAPDCPNAAAAMRQVLVTHRNDFLAAQKQLENPETIEKVTNYMTAYPADFPDLDERWQAMLDRCKDDHAVMAVITEKDHVNPGPPEPLAPPH